MFTPESPNLNREKSNDSSEQGDFKDKRAAHYNEYKLGTWLLVLMYAHFSEVN